MTKMKPLHIDENITKNPRSEPLLEEVYSPENDTLTFKKWWNESAWPGMGLFGESYLLFSIGILRPVWEALYPECFVEKETCSANLLRSLSYGVVLGVICGMIVVGTLANSIGRRHGSITTASLMAFGALGLTLVSLVLAHDANALVKSMTALLFVFGIGVGGEYPLSASSASERAMGIMKAKMALELEREEQSLRKEAVGVTQKEENPQQQKAPSPPPIEEFSTESCNPQSTQFGRGKRVLLVFTMQGMGIFVNTIVLTFLLLVFGQAGNADDNNNEEQEENLGAYSLETLLGIWRTSYAIGAAILSYVLVSRIQHLTESRVWQDDKLRREKLDRKAIEKRMRQQKKREQQEIEGVLKTRSEINNTFSDVSSLSGHSDFPPRPWSETASLKHCPSTTTEEDLKASPMTLLFRNFGWRLLGSSMSWLLWDIAFYGNKLFQSSFLLILTGEETTILELAAASMLNAFVALLGYFAAAFIVDNPNVGRVRLQKWGFLLTGTLFCLCGFLHDKLASGWLVLMYLGSSFFGQCGPNATTFLIPAEIFPTEMRTMCHGIAAASGKMGALFAAVVFSYLTNASELFFWSGYASFAACLLTFLTIPDTTTLDLYEIDRKWRMTLAGKKGDYEGDANSPEHLSFYERRKLGLPY